MQAETERGKKGAEARWSNARADAQALPEDMPEQCNSNPNSHSHSHSKEQLEAKGKSKAFLNEENVVRNALEVPDEEELLRRTRVVLRGEDLACVTGVSTPRKQPLAGEPDQPTHQGTVIGERKPPQTLAHRERRAPETKSNLQKTTPPTAP